ncbi:DUF1254 domain-containing protein [Phenylobacterium sp. SCN 70-31]|uniref:DUF1254 domain-containing protein n=1 Tax=Phenylobacterium sp. SCN 70-31 TaxID=1660129 RepID=UPI00086AF99A|nr:DUF1254 domain-containing protein [Phenylobacterium sp. SCN 70-31]ODT86250.1 MAG: phosphatidylserine decarboxylase [Phenylobacterium sp. SCN 70-31]
MPQDRLDTLRDAARTAWLYVLPLIEMASPRTRAFAGGAPPNAFAHGRDLVGPADRDITTPNNDTLYSSAHLDLSHGPVTLTLPASGDRYLSVALMDAYTNNFAVLGTRSTGRNGGRFRLVSPSEAAHGPEVVRAPTPSVWALGRILVDGPHDLDAARAVQSGLTIQGPAAEPPPPCAERHADWPAYFDSAARLLARNPPPVTDRARLEAISPLRLDDFRPDRFSAEEAAAIAEGVEQARGDIWRSGIKGQGFVDGWSYPYTRLGDFAQEHHYRASVAVGGLAALPPEEAMYMRARGDLPRALFDGRHDWRLHFPAEAPLPVDSFWSLSLYESTPDGQFFFTENPLGRYAIGDRTAGLAHNPDGSLDIWIGSRPPAAGDSNWLPAPEGPFALFMRAYLPRPELLHGAYRLPPVRRVDD